MQKKFIFYNKFTEIILVVHLDTFSRINEIDDQNFEVKIVLSMLFNLYGGIS